MRTAFLGFFYGKTFQLFDKTCYRLHQFFGLSRPLFVTVAEKQHFGPFWAPKKGFSSPRCLQFLYHCTEKTTNYVERFVKRSGYIEFSRWKICTFAPIYLKISAMEGEIFWAFLILGPMSMVLRQIFDKRANYVERFVKNREIANY